MKGLTVENVCLCVCVCGLLASTFNHFWLKTKLSFDWIIQGEALDEKSSWCLQSFVNFFSSSWCLQSFTSTFDLSAQFLLHQLFFLVFLFVFLIVFAYITCGSTSNIAQSVLCRGSTAFLIHRFNSVGSSCLAQKTSALLCFAGWKQHSCSESNWSQQR